MGNTEGRQIGVPLVQKVVVGVPCSGRLQWWQGQAHYECKVDHCFPHPTHNQIVAEYKECYQTCHLRKMQSRNPRGIHRASCVGSRWMH